MVCQFCEREPVDSYFGKWCVDCHRLKRLMAIYGDNIHRVCETVFVRTPEQQNHKIETSVVKPNEETIVDEKKEYYLRRNKK